MRIISVALGLLFTISINMLHAQDNEHEQSTEQSIEELKAEIEELKEQFDEVKHGYSGFLLTGYTNITYRQSLKDIEDSKFGYAGFSPVFLWMISDRIFFEAELQIQMRGGVHGGELTHNADKQVSDEGTSTFDLGYANMVYITKWGAVFSAGKFLTPVGIFNERFHPTWINPLPVEPIGIGHGGLLPTAELGIQVRGGTSLGSSKLTYSLFVSNGPILNDGEINEHEAGRLIYTNFLDNNANKAVGGRIGFLPFHNGSLELGVSGLYADKIGDRGSEYENVGTSIYSFDINYFTLIPRTGLLRFSGQYTALDITSALYHNSEEDVLNGEPALYGYSNTSNVFYGLVSLRTSAIKNSFLKHSEFVARYEKGHTPENSKWHFDEHRLMIGYLYWLQARSAIKIAVATGEESAIYGQFTIGL